MSFPRFKFPELQKADPPLATNATLRQEADQGGEKPCAARIKAVETVSQDADEGLRHDATFATFPRFSFPKGQKTEPTPETLATFTDCSAKVQSRVASVAESRKPDRGDASPENPLKTRTFEPHEPEKRPKVAGVAGGLSQSPTPEP